MPVDPPLVPGAGALEGARFYHPASLFLQGATAASHPGALQRQGFQRALLTSDSHHVSSADTAPKGVSLLCLEMAEPPFWFEIQQSAVS